MRNLPNLKNLETTNGIWGITAEAIFLYLSDIELKTDQLSDVIKLESLKTNIYKDEQSYRNALSSLSTYLGFSQENILSHLGKLVLIDKEPLSVIRARLFGIDYRIRGFLRDILLKKLRFVQFSEVETYFPDDTVIYYKLLASFRFLKLGKEKAEINLPLVKEVGQILNFSQSVENWICAKSLFSTTISPEDKGLVDELASELLRSFEITFTEDPRDLPLSETLKHLENHVLQTLDRILTSSKYEEILKRVRQRHSEAISHLERCLHTQEAPRPLRNIGQRKIELAARKYGIDLERSSRMINQILSLSSRFDRLYILYVESTFSLNKTDLLNILSEVFGEDVRIDSYLVTFSKKYMTKSVDDSVENMYLEFILKEYAKEQANTRAIRLAESFFLSDRRGFVDRIVSNTYAVKDSLVKETLSKRFSPFYFVYTLPSPDDLGKEIVNKYVKGNQLIQKEVRRLSDEWPLLKTEDSFSYTSMTDRFFSKGLEHELPNKEIRIMTPYTDYELTKYVSMLRRLVEKGYSLYILCRLSADQYPWMVLKDSLLKGLGEKTKAVRIRTYTRFKEFLPTSKLRKSDERMRKEFGVHGKLFIIGDADNGAVLLGSANLLDNSFNWNPECGIYTEDSRFIESAKTFFDFVWSLSEHDSLDFSKLDRIPGGPFFPFYYLK